MLNPQLPLTFARQLRSALRQTCWIRGVSIAAKGQPLRNRGDVHITYIVGPKSAQIVPHDPKARFCKALAVNHLR